MHRRPSFFLTATIFFIVGLLSYAGAQWWLRSYLLPPGTITVQGVLKFQAPSNSGDSGKPPDGYFVEAAAIKRVYVEGDLIKPFVGSLVLLQDKTLSTVCGPDTFPCYPKLLITSATPVPGKK